MGVTGLWKLIDQSGKEVLIETLENKILAIDISIWLHQVIKGFQDRKGNALQNAHLLGLFNRLCKLLYYRIKPVFVFDGSVPALKRDTIAKRQQGRTKTLQEVERIQELLREAITKEKILHDALESSHTDTIHSASTSVSPQKEKSKLSLGFGRRNKMDAIEEGIFTIPEFLSVDRMKDEARQTASSSDVNTSLSENDSFSDSNLQEYYNMNLQTIDVTSAHFKSLPADVRLEILADIKQMRKQHSWGRLHEMPSRSENFSEFQMKRLLKRRQVQVSLEQAEKELEGRCLTLSELETFLSEQGIVTAEKKAAERVSSNANTRFLLVKDLKKAIQNAAEAERKKIESAEDEILLKEASENNESIKNKNDCKILEDSEKALEKISVDSNESFQSLQGTSDEDDGENSKGLQLAIELSLNQTNVYDDNDYAAEKAILNKEQQKMFKNATGSAKDYILKFGLAKNLNLDETNESQLEKTQESDFLANLKHNRSLIAGIIHDKTRETNQPSKFNDELFDAEVGKPQATESITVISDESDTDDFIEVPESPNDLKKERVLQSEKIQINFDPEKLIKPEEDMFADIFQGEKNKHDIGIKENVVTDNIKVDNKQTISNILENLQKEVEKVKSLTLEDIKIDKPIEISSSPEDLLLVNKIDKNFLGNEIIEIRDSQDEPPITNDTDKNIPKVISEEKVNKLKNALEEILPNIEIPDSQKSVDLKDNCVIEDQIVPKKEYKIEDQSVIEIVDSQKELKVECEVTEVIEILDDTLRDKLEKTPKKINNFFKPEYVVKKTPSKSETEEIDEEVEVPKVTSPFFVKRTPGSSKKKIAPIDNEESINIRNCNISKALFVDDGSEIKDKSVQNEKQNVLEDLKSNKSKQELENMVTELNNEKIELELERNRQDRMMLTVTEKMRQECMDLLKLFGIPFIVAPMEAEAQCAFLEAIDLTNGTITDDSDIWLFGGRTVYKNFFDKQKHVLEFKSEQIQRDFSLDRDKLIQLAFLVGSDYTIGIKGIGSVTALEILAAFPSTAAVEGETSRTMSILSTLRKFRDWFKYTKNGSTDVMKTKLRQKLKSIEIGDNFPNLAIAEAYLFPTIDNSKETFSWGTPDLEAISAFTKKYFGWTQKKTDETMGPVLKRLEQKKSQTTIKNFFTVKSSTYNREVVLSKRVEKAIKKIAINDGSDSEDLNNTVQNVSKVRPKKNKRKSIQQIRDSAEPEQKIKSKPTVTKIPRKRKNQKNENNELMKPDPATLANKIFGESPEKKTKVDDEIEAVEVRKPCIPQTKQLIPQRERDIEEMNKRKEIASALFKRTRANGKKSKKA